MNVTTITTTEFRKNMKRILDEQGGNTFFLRRGDDLFEVRYYGVVGIPAGYEGETKNVNDETVTPSFGTYMQEHPQVEKVLPEPVTSEDMELDVARQYQEDVDAYDASVNQDPDAAFEIERKKRWLDDFWVARMQP